MILEIVREEFERSSSDVNCVESRKIMVWGCSIRCVGIDISEMAT